MMELFSYWLLDCIENEDYVINEKLVEFEFGYFESKVKE